MQDATIALTGGTGFIGRRFAALARAEGYRIRQLVRRDSADFPPEDEVCPFDLEAVDNDLPLHDCIALVHLAAYIPRNHGDLAAAERCWTINAHGTLRLIEAAANAGVGKVVQTTSANAYAASASYPDESAPLFPRGRSYYLGSKILQEIYAAEYCRTSGIALTTLRLGSVYGPGQTSGALGVMVRAALDGRPIQIANAGRFGSDLVHVDDVARALLVALASNAAGPVNVGSSVRTTKAQLARMIADLTGGQIVEISAAQPSDDTGFPALDIGYLRSLGWAPMPLAEGLKDMIERGAGDSITTS